MFGLLDLENRAKETPQVDSIEISYGQFVYMNSPSLHGLFVDVALSNLAVQGRLKQQTVRYMASSSLGPVNGFAVTGRGWDGHPEAGINVVRDELITDAFRFDGCEEHGYRKTFWRVTDDETPNNVTRQNPG